MKINKKIVSLLLVFLMIVALVGCKKVDETLAGSSQTDESQVSSMTSDDESSYESSQSGQNGQSSQVQVSSATSSSYIADKDKKIILCFGDSITEGYGMKSKDEPYPAVLQSKLGDAYKVYNAGVGGEKAAAIMSRANIIEFALSEDVLFEANELTAKLSIGAGFVVAGTGEKIEYKGTGNQLPTNTIEIGGKKYEIKEVSGAYNITRSESGKRLLIPKGTLVKYDYSKYFDECYCAVVLVGANDNDSGSDALIEKFKTFAANFERCIFITPFYYTDYSQKFDTAFGRKTINIKAYFRGDVFEDYGIEITRVTQHYLEKTTDFPVIFTLSGKVGEPHLSALGYKVLGGEVYKRGVELGYWK